MTVRRITPEEVVQAYQETGLQPVFNMWGEAESNCGCALTALALHQMGRQYNISLSEIIRMLELESIEDKQYFFGEDMSSDYLTGFVNGFDDASPDAIEWNRLCASSRDDFETGLADGLATREKVKEVFNIVD
jgi:hypothetical protein